MNPKFKFYLNVYFTAYILGMPIWIGATLVAGGKVNEISLVVWLLIAAMEYMHNEVFHSTLEWLGWKSK